MRKDESISLHLSGKIFMELERIRHYLMSKQGAAEDYPFGPEVMVFKVMGKMFALIPWDKEPLQVNLKCEPDTAMILREIHEAVKPGYHMNKKHWNTIVINGSLPEEIILNMIDESYDLVVKKLKKSDREKLKYK